MFLKALPIIGSMSVWLQTFNGALVTTTKVTTKVPKQKRHSQPFSWNLSKLAMRLEKEKNTSNLGSVRNLSKISFLICRSQVYLPRGRPVYRQVDSNPDWITRIASNWGDFFLSYFKVAAPLRYSTSPLQGLLSFRLNQDYFNSFDCMILAEMQTPIARGCTAYSSFTDW